VPATLIMATFLPIFYNAWRTAISGNAGGLLRWPIKSSVRSLALLSLQGIRSS